MSIKPRKDRQRYWWLVALGLVPVLLLVWWRGDVEGSSPGEVSSQVAGLEENWPSPSLSEDAEGFLGDAMELTCEGATACHALWADHDGNEEAFALVASADDEGQLWAHAVTLESEDGEPAEPTAAEPYEFAVNTPALPIEVRSQEQVQDMPAWLFPEGAGGFGLLRHDAEEEGVVVEEPHELTGEHMNRVVVFDDSDTSALLRYQYEDRTLYTLGRDLGLPLCVGEDTARCSLSLPSEEALVSVAPVLASLTADRDLELTMEFDEEIDLTPDLGGTVEEPLSEGETHVARLNWQEVSAEADDTDTPQEYAHVLYFDDGAPAARALHVAKEQETVLTEEPPEEDGNPRMNGVAVFPGLVPDEETALVVIAFHPPGYRPPLLAPEPDTAHDDDDVTVYEPMAASELLPLSYIRRDGDARPLVSGWLDDTESPSG